MIADVARFSTSRLDAGTLRGRACGQHFLLAQWAWKNRLDVGSAQNYDLVIAMWKQCPSGKQREFRSNAFAYILLFIGLLYRPREEYRCESNHCARSTRRKQSEL